MEYGRHRHAALALADSAVERRGTLEQGRHRRTAWPRPAPSRTGAAALGVDPGRGGGTEKGQSPPSLPPPRISTA